MLLFLKRIAKNKCLHKREEEKKAVNINVISKFDKTHINDFPKRLLLDTFNNELAYTYEFFFWRLRLSRIKIRLIVVTKKS